MNAKMKYEKKRTLKQVSFNLESLSDFSALETANEIEFSIWVKEKLHELKKHPEAMVNDLMKKCKTESNLFRNGARECAYETKKESTKDLMNIPEFAAGYYAMMGYIAAIKSQTK